MPDELSVIEAFLKGQSEAPVVTGINATLSKTRLVLVEGTHEVHFFTAWLRHLGRDDIQVLAYGGKDSLKEYLTGLVRESAFEAVTHLLVLRDADNNPTGAFRSVCSALSGFRDSPFTAPQEPGTWVAAAVGVPTLCVTILPGGDQPGALEELLLQTAAGDPLYAPAMAFIDNACIELEKAGAHRPPPPLHKRGKARAHAYIATWKKPDLDPGKAAREGVWDFEHPALQFLRDLLGQMS